MSKLKSQIFEALLNNDSEALDLAIIPLVESGNHALLNEIAKELPDRFEPTFWERIYLEVSAPLSERYALFGFCVTVIDKNPPKIWTIKTSHIKQALEKIIKPTKGKNRAPLHVHSDLVPIEFIHTQKVLDLKEWVRSEGKRLIGHKQQEYLNHPFHHIDGELNRMFRTPSQETSQLLMYAGSFMVIDGAVSTNEKKWRTAARAIEQELAKQLNSPNASVEVMPVFLEYMLAVDAGLSRLNYVKTQYALNHLPKEIVMADLQPEVHVTQIEGENCAVLHLAFDAEHSVVLTTLNDMAAIKNMIDLLAEWLDTAGVKHLHVYLRNTDSEDDDDEE